MAKHQLQEQLETAIMESSGKAFLTPSGYLLGWGAAKPTDAATGWCTGAIFIVVGGADGANIFVNDGDTTSSDFNLVVITAA